ncbi:methionine ABC transporter ATP-binding protein [Clostridium botulinum]|uniref:Methionine ABC transporter ATP-binding protein n=1 Tax=Clostridium botulinum C/D str. DC5 TaxID=1443128 RepID=A0A0A0IF92_CLOBO|nr:methionine ABC transporter ATP-binding protein [Clostridium botulinum]KEI01100.1 methionine ABC transporter ATP-binding protein [Clostridium botulinum C/D str. BKT75002]KEI13421.1 methionine ABC transporter ATP-binding protein [Clostridium botulinum C/D str. BKT2873]KGM95145.1 methionine ABC transporter ATP-binding protein [Clostridium botulinum D str. CCUG 7971]KGN00135.1 methionine ABC transporter ATP-binding protein [Clostridium botulinum C/D str. DC5]KOC50762.1 methionine ABC transporte
MIQIKNVEKFFGENKVLKNVSIEVKQGEIYGVVGHSGAGKSTLLRCINGLESYNSGNVIVDEKEVKELNEKELREFRKNIGMIFQNFSLLNRKNVWKNIALPMETWGYKKEEINKRVSELLNLVGLGDKEKSMPNQLSGGQKQRVAIARALTLNPKILLCDEATSALDPKTTKSILALLREINEKLGITIVIVTHQMEVVKDICSKVALMESGKLIQSGKVDELFLNPTKQMQNLLGEEEVLPDKGINIKIFFPKQLSQSSVITSMARELQMDFSIVWGRLEKFNEEVLGSLVINVGEKQKNDVVNYLSNTDVHWEVL